MNYWEIIKERRRKHLQDKYTIKPYHSVWRGLRLAMLPTSYLLQLITAIPASSLPAFAIFIMCGSWYYGFIAAAVFMFVFEYIKRTIVNNTTLSYFNRGTVSFVGIAAVLLVVGLSVASSGIGTPILVENFAPMPIKPSEEAIKQPYSERKAEAVQYWKEVKESALSKAKEVRDAATYKGVVAYKALGGILAYETQAKASTDSLNAALARIDAEQQAAVSKANEEYLTDTEKRTTQKSTLGYWLMFVTLFLELCFIGCYAWLNYYDFREAAELGLVAVQSEAKLNEVRPIMPQTSGKVKESEVKKAPQQRPSNIGFNSEGRIVKEGTKLTIICRNHKQELKPYDSSTLSSIIRQGNSRSDYWQEMKDKLEEAKKR